MRGAPFYRQFSRSLPAKPTALLFFLREIWYTIKHRDKRSLASVWRYGVKKILKFLLSRTFLFGLLIACQVGLFAALMLVFSRAGTVAYIILTLVSVLLVIE